MASPRRGFPSRSPASTVERCAAWPIVPRRWYGRAAMAAPIRMTVLRHVALSRDRGATRRGGRADGVRILQAERSRTIRSPTMCAIRSTRPWSSGVRRDLQQHRDPRLPAQRRLSARSSSRSTPTDTELVIEVKDHGRPFDIEGVPPLPSELDEASLPEGGMGIHIAKTMLDEMTYEPGPPNRWRLCKRLTASSAVSSGRS